MAASFLSSSRRHLSSSTATAAAAISTSAAAVKSKLRKTFDPDEALTLASSADPTSSSSRFAFDLAARRLSRSRRFADVRFLLQGRRETYPQSKQDEHFLSTLILTYGSAFMLPDARKLFDEIPQPTSTSFNALLSAQIKAKKPHFVPQLFVDLPAKHESIVPDSVSYGILIKSFCLSGKTQKAFEAFSELKEKGMEPSLIVYTTLVDSYYKMGKREEAEKLWDEMVGKGIKPDLAAYNVKAMYPAKNGSPEEVVEVMREMEAAEMKPDAITRNYLITCYCRNGRFEEAKEAYKEFRKKRIDPNAGIFKMLVQFLCENGDFDGGLMVCRDSMKCNKIPDFKTTSALVEGLVKGGKVEEAKEVIGVVKERFPDNLLGGWRMLEQKLGLSVDGQVSEQPQVEAA